MVLSALVRGLALLQRYPLPLLLPLLVIAASGVGVNHLVAGLTLTKFAHFLVFVVGLLIRYLLACAGFLCVANYTVRSEANGERPEVSNLLDSLAFPGCVKLLTGLLARFAAALVVAGAVTIILSTSALRVFKATTRHPVPRLVSGEVYLWIAIVLAILVLSRWLLAIPLFVQSRVAEIAACRKRPGHPGPQTFCRGVYAARCGAFLPGRSVDFTASSSIFKWRHAVCAPAP